MDKTGLEAVALEDAAVAFLGIFFISLLSFTCGSDTFFNNDESDDFFFSAPLLDSVLGSVFTFFWDDGPTEFSTGRFEPFATASFAFRALTEAFH